MSIRSYSETGKLNLDRTVTLRAWWKWWAHNMMRLYTTAFECNIFGLNWEENERQFPRWRGENSRWTWSPCGVGEEWTFQWKSRWEHISAEKNHEADFNNKTSMLLKLPVLGHAKSSRSTFWTISSLKTVSSITSSTNTTKRPLSLVPVRTLWTVVSTPPNWARTFVSFSLGLKVFCLVLATFKGRLSLSWCIQKTFVSF